MASLPAFRCPFEVKGEQDGTILDVCLGEDRAMRFAAIAAAFREFATSPKSPAIRFQLAPVLWQECKTIFALRRPLVPFQSEILATELELRLTPFLPYQIYSAPKHCIDETQRADPARLWTAHALAGVMATTSEGALPRSVDDVASWLEKVFVSGMARGQKNPNVLIVGPYGSVDSDRRHHLLTISPSIAEFTADTLLNPADPTLNRNTFSIVKCPFYPKAFGRYSENVEIVVTRKADVAVLSDKTAVAIRTQANKVHKRHGVRIRSLANDKQETGLWVPQYRLR